VTIANKRKIRITNSGAKGFFARTREHARKLDRGDKVALEVTISFESAADMMKVLSPERVRILDAAREGVYSVSILASELKRDTRAVSRDVDLLEQFGLLSTRYETNPGHGRLRIVEPRAEKYRLVATV
jgi:predicted transcriptional regulator